MSETTHNPTSEEPSASPLRGLIAASIDSGLAGLLSSVLAQHRDASDEATPTVTESLFEDDAVEQPMVEQPVLVASTVSGGPELDDSLFAEPTLSAAPSSTASVAAPEVPEAREVHEVHEAPQAAPQPAAEEAPLSRRAARAGRLGPRLADATGNGNAAGNETGTETPTPQVAAEAQATRPQSFDSNPVYTPDVSSSARPSAPTQPAQPEVRRQSTRLLTTLQIGLLLEGLSQLRARPGEDGLPPGMLLMDVKGPLGRYNNDSLYTIRAQIDAAVRAGDMALVTPDIGIVLFCGGLFFPGDLEVMGARIRRRALDANPAVSSIDELQVIVAGALSSPGEDPSEFIHRGVAAFDQSIDSTRQDIVISYADDRVQF
jgi:hypothetical protein